MFQVREKVPMLQCVVLPWHLVYCSGHDVGGYVMDTPVRLKKCYSFFKLMKGHCNIPCEKTGLA